jgi:lipopolysaccharide export LptBFGC system permease protein LptF
LYDRVAQRIAELRRWMTHRELLRTLQERAARTGQVQLHLQILDDSRGPVGADAVLRAGQIIERDPNRWEVLPKSGSDHVEFVVYRNGQPQYAIRSAKAVFRARIHLTNQEPTLSLEFGDHEETDLTVPSARPLRFDRRQFSEMNIDSPIVSELLQKTPRELVLHASTYGEDAVLNKLKQGISTETVRLKRNIIARIHERTAMSVSCMVMMLLGSVLAIYMRSTLPLTVYLWSFVPAILGLVLISSGADVVKDVGTPGQGDLIGLIVMWSGNGIMFVISLIIFLRVRRN